MDMENQENPVDSLIDRIKSYVETRIDLFKLKAIDKSSSFLSLLFSMIIMIFMCFSFIMLLSVGVALLIGDMMGKSYYGFFIVAGFYLILGLIIYTYKTKWLKIPMANKMVKHLTD